MTPPAPNTTSPLLQVSGLHVDFTTEGGPPVHAVRGVDLTLRRGETVAVVGESGSGKSTTALALLRMLPGSGRIVSGSVRLDGRELTGLGEDALQSVRGARIGMIFQDPMTSLNPVLTVGRQLDEVLRAHARERGEPRGDRRSRRRRARELLELVGVPDPARRLDDHPHQFSGGQRQRVLIAMALANEPDVLVADEPTTALDATVQEQILRLLAELNEKTGTALLLITHSLGVVARSCERVVVMYGGTVVEDGPTAEVLADPRHPYTAGLLAAVPRLSAPSGTRLAGIPGAPPDLSLPVVGCAFAARCGYADAECGASAPPLVTVGAAGAGAGAAEDGARRAACHHRPELAAAPVAAVSRTASERRSVSAVPGLPAGSGPSGVDGGSAPALLEAVGLRKEFVRRGRGGRRDPLVAVDGVGLRLDAGETLGIVGESGSGKSTLARMLVHAHAPDAGVIRLRGEDVTHPTRAALRTLRREVQMVFQDPYASLNPRMTAGQIIAEPLLAQGEFGDPAERRRRVDELLTQVGLDPSAGARRPRAFSGGQRQRIGIARALAPAPSVLVCDEPVAALDVSVQAQIVNLLGDLQRELGLAVVFIAHDLAVVRQVSHRIVVMRGGRVVESGAADAVCESPREAYTGELLAASPDPVRVVVAA